MKHTQEEIKEKFESLPEDLKQVVSSVDTTGKIVDIAEKYRIQIDEIGELLDETTLVMLGFTHPNDFVDNIKKRLDISRELAETLTREINAEIFVKIKESLVKLHEKKENFVEEKQPLAVTNPPVSTQPPASTQPVVANSAIQNIQDEHHEFDRDKILREIEEPSTIIEPVKKEALINEITLKPAVENVVEKPVIEQVVVEKTTTEQVSIEKPIMEQNERPRIDNSLEKPTIERNFEIQEKTETTPATNLVERKLTESVRIPMEEKKIVVDSGTTPNKQVLKVDPYREPIE